MLELTNKLPTLKSECWLLEKPYHSNCAKEFLLFLKKRDAITAKVMAPLLAQAPEAAKVEKSKESTKTKDSQDQRR